MVRSMARSNVIALVVVTPMMVLLVGDWRRGLASMVPNLIPLYLTALAIPADSQEDYRLEAENRVALDHPRARTGGKASHAGLLVNQDSE